MKSLLLLLIFIVNAVASQPLSLFEPKGNCPQKLTKASFTLCYHPDHRLALWALHSLTKEDITGSIGRSNDYRADKTIQLPVSHKDYGGSGYDRGHLVPAADRKKEKDHMSETFLMSNMTPQHPSFNRGIWQQLERQVRKWVLFHGDAIVITAPHLFTGLREFRKGISLPEQHYKILYWPKKKMALAFLITNENLRGRTYADFQVTVDEIEELTNLNFFSHLKESEQELLERRKIPLPQS